MGEYYKIKEMRLKKEMILWDDFSEEGEFSLDPGFYLIKRYDIEKLRKMGNNFSYPPEIFIEDKGWIQFDIDDGEEWKDFFEE